MVGMAMVERRDDGSFRVRWDVVVTAVVWLVTVMLAYGSLDARIQVLTDRYLRMSADVAEIKGDVKTLVQREPRP